MKKDSKNRSIETFILLSVFIFLFSLTFISAQPQTNLYIEFEEGLVISTSPQNYLTQNTNHTVNFFVYNKTSGVPVDNTTISCELYIDNSKGELIYFEEVDYSPEGYWHEELNENIFSEQGFHQYGIKCGDTDFGGSTVGSWEVTPSGKGGTENTIFFIFIIILLYGITFFGFFGRNIPMTILGGMALLFLGVYLINEGIIIFRDTITLYISYLTIGVGGITAFWALLEQFDVI